MSSFSPEMGHVQTGHIKTEDVQNGARKSSPVLVKMTIRILLVIKQQFYSIFKKIILFLSKNVSPRETQLPLGPPCSRD